MKTHTIDIFIADFDLPVEETETLKSKT